jgi:hypothetical protein
VTAGGEKVNAAGLTDRDPNEPLAAWLTAHMLTDGLATYWQANSTNVDSHGRIILSAVVQDVRDRLVPVTARLAAAAGRVCRDCRVWRAG